MINLNDKEAKILSYWKERDINNKVRQKNKDGKKYYFLDGPPYVTGDLHPGQMWVKTIKDINLRYRRFQGLNVRDKAGYDVHGLPIENKVEKLLLVNSKKEIETKIGVETFIKKCREYVDSFKGRMNNDYNRFGISLDFENPYLPYTNEYIDAEWGMLKRIDEKGFLYRGKKTTAFCTRCETALAQGSMEVTYTDTDDPSIYVAFKTTKSPSERIKTDDNTYLLIWTTTPWTLPANMAIAVNPKEIYVLASAGGRNFIVAKERLDAVISTIGESAIIKSEFYGSELEGLSYVSPLEKEIPKQKELRKYHKVVASEELVAMNEGTGLVHIAPGHGLEDYILGVKKKLPIFSPVAPNGLYTNEAGIYEGIKVPVEGNKRIIDDLKKIGALLQSGSIRHSYPYCWRCDSKLIYIATEQWFLNVQKIKKKLIAENDKVVWHPDEAKGWLKDVLESSPDWCISRQRYWATPLPIWMCSKCDSTVTIGSLKELKEKAINKEKVEALRDLHRPYIDAIKIKCHKCSSEMHRIPDVVDVWFDAGTCFRSSMSEQEFESTFPVDYIIEGKDQLRGWFSYLLKASVMAYGKRPYKHIGIDGMLLDEKGREMHKKLGNYVGLDEVYGTVGADTFRLWCTDHTPWLDLSYNKSEIRDAGKTLLILYNISNLLFEYQGAADYAPVLKRRLSTKGMDIEDAWIVSRLELTIEGATKHLDNYEAYDAASMIKRFVMEDFSRFYLKMAKKGVVYGNKKKAKQVLDVINYVLYKIIVMISPITPFTAESIYLERFHSMESVFLEDWPKANSKSISKDVDEKMDVAREAITAILNGREKAGVGLRQPIKGATIETSSASVETALIELSGLVESYCNLKELKIEKGPTSVKSVKPIFVKLGPAFKENVPVIVEELAKQDADKLEEKLMSTGSYPLRTKSGIFEILPEHVTIVENPIGKEGIQFKYGVVKLDTTESEELRKELFVREMERAIQLMRKENGLTMRDMVYVSIECSDMTMALLKKAGSLNETVRAKGIYFGKPKDWAHKKNVEIENESMVLWIKKA